MIFNMKINLLDSTTGCPTNIDETWYQQDSATVDYRDYVASGSFIKIEDEYEEVGFRIIKITEDTVHFIEKNLGDYFIHMTDGTIHAISERECKIICGMLGLQLL